MATWLAKKLIGKKESCSPTNSSKNQIHENEIPEKQKRQHCRNFSTNDALAWDGNSLKAENDGEQRCHQKKKKGWKRRLGQRRRRLSLGDGSAIEESQSLQGPSSLNLSNLPQTRRPYRPPNKSDLIYTSDPSDLENDIEASPLVSFTPPYKGPHLAPNFDNYTPPPALPNSVPNKKEIRKSHMARRDGRMAMKSQPNLLYSSGSEDGDRRMFSGMPSSPDFLTMKMTTPKWKAPSTASASWSDGDTECSTTDPIGGILDWLGGGGFEAMMGERWELTVEIEAGAPCYQNANGIQVQVQCLEKRPLAGQVAVAAFNMMRERHEDPEKAWPPPLSLQLFDPEEGQGAYHNEDALSQSTHGKRTLLLRVSFLEENKDDEQSSLSPSNSGPYNLAQKKPVDSVRQKFIDQFRSGPHACFPLTSANYKHEDCFDNNVWTEPDASSFNVRGPLYLRKKVKQPSQQSAYLLLGSDLLMSDHPGRECVAEDPDGFVARARAIGGEQTPFVFIVNFVLPWANFVAYWSPRNGSTTAYIGDPVFDRTMERFLEGDDALRNSRFKLIPRCVQGPWVVRKTANGKPAVLGNKLKQKFFQGDGYLEVSIDNASSAGASYILKMIKNYALNIVMDLSYVLQGEAEDELPERLIGSMRWHRVDLENAWKYNDWMNRPTDM